MPTASSPNIRRIIGLLAVQSVVVILLSINRLSALTLGYVAANEFLRWVDFHNMLTIPLVSLVASYLLIQQMEYDSAARHGFAHRMVLLVFVLGVYLLGAGYGNHEITNYLHSRICPEGEDSMLCQIIMFNDDEFSHWVWFLGFTLMNAMQLALQVLFPHPTKLSRAHIGLLALNGLFIGLGVFANLAFEEIGLDLYIVAVLALLAIGIWWRRGAQPLAIYFTVAYGFGLVATSVYKVVID
jgi:hypothetical protein